MVNNTLNITPGSGLETPLTPKSIKKQRSAIQEVLEQNLIEKSASLTLSPSIRNRGLQSSSSSWLLWITSLFKRIFFISNSKKSTKNIFSSSSMTNDQKMQAQNLMIFIDDVKSKLDKLEITSKQNEFLQNNLQGKFPDIHTCALSDAFCKSLFGDVNVKNDLGLYGEFQEIKSEIDKNQKKATDIGVQNPAFTLLADEILSLDERINYSLKQIKITEKLLLLEKTITEYSANPNWEHFQEIIDLKINIENLVKKILKKNFSFLIHDPRSKNFLNKNSLNDLEICQFIKTFYPGINSLNERLYHSELKIKEARIKKAKEHLLHFFPLIKKDDEQLLRLDSLNTIDRAEEVGTKFSKVFYEFLYGLGHFKKEITKTLQLQKSIYAEFLITDPFCNDEIQWMANFQPYLERKLYSYQQKRADLHLNHLIQELTDLLYTQNLVTTSHLQPLIEDLMKYLHESISLLKIPLPDDIDHKTYLEQLKIHLDFLPKLRGQNERFFELIENKNLNSLFNLTIENLIEANTPDTTSLATDLTQNQDHFSDSGVTVEDNIQNILPPQKNLTFSEQIEVAIKQKLADKNVLPNSLSNSEDEIDESEEDFESKVQRLPSLTAFEKYKKEILSGSSPSFLDDTGITQEEKKCLIQINRRRAIEPLDEALLKINPVKILNLSNIAQDTPIITLPPSNNLETPSPYLIDPTSPLINPISPPIAPIPPPVIKSPLDIHTIKTTPFVLKKEVKRTKKALKKPILSFSFNLDDVLDQISAKKITFTDSFLILKNAINDIKVDSISFGSYFHKLINEIGEDRIKENDIPQEIKEVFSDIQKKNMKKFF